MKDIQVEGFSLTIEEGVESAEGTVKISAIQCESFDFFESGFIKLARINFSTIFLAFQQESPSIKYRLNRSQNTLQVMFMIDQSFLPPFSESIILQKNIEHEARSKIINSQIAEATELETLLSKLKVSNHRVQQKDKWISDSKEPVWAEVFSPGCYLVEISGFLGVCYYQGFDQVGNIQENTAAPFQVSIEEACVVTKVETFNFNFGHSHIYQTPFSFSCLLRFKQEGKAFIRMNILSNFINKAYCFDIISSVSQISQ